MDDSEPAEDGLLAGLRWNRSARDQAQLKHKIRDLPGLLKHGLHLRKKSQSPDTIPGPSAGPTVNKSCSQSFPCAGRAVRNGFLSHGPYPAKDKIHLARIIRCNGEAELGSKALDDVLYRAQLELFPEALLVGNAIKSTQQGAALKSNTKEGARSIQVEITPTASRISRNAVTSLSIRGHRWKRHDAVDLGSPDELMDISEADEGGMAPDTNPPTIIISNSVTALNLRAKAIKKYRLGGRSSKDKESSPLPIGRAASESVETSVKRLTLTSSQSVPKAGALTSLTRTASAVFSRSFEQVAAGTTPAPGNHTAPESGTYSCSLQEEGTAYLNHTQRSPSISAHLGSDL
ncbi:hyccin-like isoform 2-T3 [Syngnathus typhle]